MVDTVTIVVAYLSRERGQSLLKVDQCLRPVRDSGPLRAVSFLGGFRTLAAELAAPSLMRPASETLHNRGCAAKQKFR